MAVSTPSVNPLPKCQSIGPCSRLRRTPDFGTANGPSSTKCSDANFYFLIEAVATVLPAVRPFDFFSVLTVVLWYPYGVPELCVC